MSRQMVPAGSERYILHCTINVKEHFALQYQHRFSASLRATAVQALNLLARTFHLPSTDGVVGSRRWSVVMRRPRKALALRHCGVVSAAPGNRDVGVQGPAYQDGENDAPRIPAGGRPALRTFALRIRPLRIPGAHPRR